jgi:fatty-acyl-CoA synthase
MTGEYTLLAAVTEIAATVGSDTVALGTPSSGGAVSAQLTYGQLLHESAALAAGLSQSGVHPGDAIAVWMPNVPEWGVIELAAARLGCTIVPINTRYRVQDAQLTLRGVGASTVFVATGFHGLDLLGYLRDAAGWKDSNPSRWAAVLPRLERVFTVDVTRSGTIAPVGTVSYREVLVDEPAEVASAAGPETPLNLFMTSGSSGSPKVAIHPQRSIVSRGRAAAHRLDVRPGDNILCALPLCGVWGMVLAATSMVAGARCTLLPLFDADAVAELIAAEGVTHFHGGDDMFRGVLNSPAFVPARSRRWRSGYFGNFSGRPAADIVDAGDRHGIFLAGAYGSSELLALLAVNVRGAEPTARALAGGPLISDEMQARIVDPATGAECPHDQPGELQVSGPSVMIGYLGNDTATREAFTADGWYRTGDLCSRTQTGEVYFSSRLKDTMRLRGFLVDPQEIEEHLLSDPEVCEAHVVGVAADGVDRAVAFVTLNPGSDATEDSLRETCRAKIAGYKVPARIVVMDEVPVLNSPNGSKVDVVTLRSMAQALDDRPEGSLGRTSTQRQGESIASSCER